MLFLLGFSLLVKPSKLKRTGLGLSWFHGTPCLVKCSRFHEISNLKDCKSMCGGATELDKHGHLFLEDDRRNLFNRNYTM